MATKKTARASSTQVSPAPQPGLPRLTLQSLNARLTALELELKTLRSTVVSTEDLARVTSAVLAAWDGLHLDISEDAVSVKYEKMDHDSDQTHPEKEGVLVGWGFGSLMGDYRTWWRTHRFRKPDLKL